MKSTDKNPSAAALEVTPGPIDDADDGGLGQLPIAISDGDFSTPIKRTRTITRPRGLRTLEQPGVQPTFQPAVHPPSQAVSDEPLPETISDQDTPTRRLDLSRNEASAVDEFLAAPPTPNPEILETPAPELVLSPERGGPLEPELLVIVENVELAEDLRESARKRESPGSNLRVTPSASTPMVEGAGESESLSWTAGDRIDQGGPASSAEPQVPETVEILAASAHEFESGDGLAPHHSYDNLPDVSEFPAPTPSPSPSPAASAESTERTSEPDGSQPDGSQSDLSPLAQTLANIAEDMHGEAGIEAAIDVDVADAPLVPRPRVPATPPPRAAPPPLPAVAAPPSVDGVSAKAARLPMTPLASLPEALAERPRRPKRSKPWFEEVFDESYLRTLPFMTAEQTLQEVDFIESSLGLPRGCEILDVACGYGRHAIELVQRGLSVTGLDLSLPLLIRAADESQRRGVSVNFIHADMREMSFERQFSGAYCMLTSFGYFDEESNVKVAEAVAKALKPGGRFLIDTINRDYVVGDLPARIWWEGDGCVVLEEVDFNFNTNRIVTHRSIVFEDGQQLEHEISIRVYSLHELGKLLRQAGFRVLEVSGGISTKGHFLGANSRNLLILAERRSD